MSIDYKLAGRAIGDAIDSVVGRAPVPPYAFARAYAGMQPQQGISDSALYQKGQQPPTPDGRLMRYHTPPIAEVYTTAKDTLLRLLML